MKSLGGPVGFARIPKRRLPPLREALVDPTIEARPLSSVAVPPNITRTLASAKRILVIGHANPADGDCVGSALGLARGMAALGKHAVAVVDQQLPAGLRALDVDHQLKRATDIDPADFDLVVLVDVAQANRTGDMAAIIGAAKNVMVMDHHIEADVKAALGLSDSASLTAWVDVGFDAAALQVGAAVAAVGHAVGGDVNAAATAAAMPVAAGIYTDTLGFAAPGTDMAALSLFKGLVTNVLGDGSSAGALSVTAALEQRLRPQLPDDVKALVADAIDTQTRTGPMGSEPVLAVKPEALARALQALQAHDPHAVEGDITGAFFNALDSALGQSGCKHAALVMPGRDGGWRVSVRGADALDVVKSLSSNGGGKPGAGVAVIGADAAGTIDDAIAIASRGLADLSLKAVARLRLGR